MFAQLHSDALCDSRQAQHLAHASHQVQPKPQLSHPGRFRSGLDMRSPSLQM
jgi:hypothetical protein